LVCVFVSIVSCDALSVQGSMHIYSSWYETLKRSISRPADLPYRNCLRCSLSRESNHLIWSTRSWWVVQYLLPLPQIGDHVNFWWSRCARHAWHNRILLNADWLCGDYYYISWHVLFYYT
jgi:hypothetical protein